MTPDRDKFEKYFADLKRVCEVEDTVIEWFDKSVHQQICQEVLYSTVCNVIESVDWCSRPSDEVAQV